MLCTVPDAAASACADEDTPCCALFADGGTAGGGDDPDSEHGSIRTLSYREALQGQHKHAMWLRDLLLKSGCDGSCGSDDEPTRIDIGNPTPTADRGTLYLVYLSSNNIDLILSVLACSSLSNDTNNTVSSAAAAAIVPTLLNTRWTTAEMVKALRPKEHAVAGIVYSIQYEKQAHELAQRLGKGRLGRTCFPIPHFSHACFKLTVNTMHDETCAPRNASFPSDGAVFDEIQRLAARDRNCAAAAAAAADADQDAVILFTSGTSSSKGAEGVRLSHRALMVQALAKLLPPVSYSNRTILLATTVPLYHVGGFSSILAVWMAGGCLAFPAASSASSPPSPSFDPPQVFRSIRTAHVNTLVVVPAMLHALRTSHEAGLASESSSAYPYVRCILIGGQSASEALIRYCRETFPNARLVQTYACTEAASSITFRRVKGGGGDDEPPSPGAVFAGDCVGTPPPHVEVAILPLQQQRDDNDMNLSAVDGGPEPQIDDRGAVGVIATRGPHVMSGYWDSSTLASPPQASISHAPESYNWHVTGDLGRIDDRGQLWFCGRVSDSIRTGGETVMAGEVERVLQVHPDVVDVAVFPLPDDKFGQIVACAIVCRERGCDICADDRLVSLVRTWCNQHGLAGYKRPKRVFVVNELPKNASGKTLKYLLVERFSQSGSSLPNSRL
jgi:acyl-CoA synthetase (AMP-forming)/AMP-acid ligase II